MAEYQPIQCISFGSCDASSGRTSRYRWLAIRLTAYSLWGIFCFALASTANRTSRRKPLAIRNWRLLHLSVIWNEYPCGRLRAKRPIWSIIGLIDYRLTSHQWNIPSAIWMLCIIDSIEIFNPWLKPLTRNVSNLFVELLKYSLVELLWKTFASIDKYS